MCQFWFLLVWWLLGSGPQPVQAAEIPGFYDPGAPPDLYPLVDGLHNFDYTRNTPTLPAVTLWSGQGYHTFTAGEQTLGYARKTLQQQGANVLVTLDLLGAAAPPPAVDLLLVVDPDVALSQLGATFEVLRDLTTLDLRVGVLRAGDTGVTLPLTSAPTLSMTLLTAAAETPPAPALPEWQDAALATARALLSAPDARPNTQRLIFSLGTTVGPPIASGVAAGLATAQITWRPLGRLDPLTPPLSGTPEAALATRVLEALQQATVQPPTPIVLQEILSERVLRPGKVTDVQLTALQLTPASHTVTPTTTSRADARVTYTPTGFELRLPALTAMEGLRIQYPVFLSTYAADGTPAPVTTRSTLAIGASQWSLPQPAIATTQAMGTIAWHIKWPDFNPWEADRAVTLTLAHQTATGWQPDQTLTTAGLNHTFTAPLYADNASLTYRILITYAEPTEVQSLTTAPDRFSLTSSTREVTTTAVPLRLPYVLAVHYPDHSPLTKQLVTITRTNTGEPPITRATTLQANGQILATPLPYGRYQVAVVAPSGFSAAPLAFTVTARNGVLALTSDLAEPTQLMLQLDPFWLRLNLTRSDGAVWRLTDAHAASTDQSAPNASFTGLTAGDYVLQEVTAPADQPGLQGQFHFTLTPNGALRDLRYSGTDLTEAAYRMTATLGTANALTFTLNARPVAPLRWPQTGGSAAISFWAGLLTLLLATCLLITRSFTKGGSL
ncbi:MSCRAMM family protein [Lacticaseibacillus absianus]|uniref:MSCRAMM family protein n=1 Tax=Lacticaseibacillus absianus TaxID=2729623 RepID=UPI0015CDC3E7|nr:prealbumin-like fold domain-containing protein [Lacticaseibacillus absianus]